MIIFIEQTFPLGRFHATPWKAFPYDDPHGEWPPSPWRLLRAVIARSYQLERETGAPNDDVRKQLVQAFAQSSISWYLPKFTWRGPGLRQYQPAEFKKVPAGNKKPGKMTYNTTKVQDNFWLTSPNAEPILWRLESEQWLLPVQKLLAACLDRMTYFGRAESITSARLLDREPTNPSTNCSLTETRSDTSVPVLCPRADATMKQILMTTDDKAVADSTAPPGAVWKFAIRPQRPAAKPTPMIQPQRISPVRLIQFAIGSRVAPTVDSIVVLTHQFRGRTIRAFLGDSWKNVQKAGDVESLNAVSLLSGKDADGEAIRGHRHAYYGIWFDRETKKPFRFLVWRRDIPFSEREQRAFLDAAQHPLALNFSDPRNRKNKNEKHRDPWTIHLVPLDSSVPPPPGFDLKKPSRSWKSAIPYVPPRHVFNCRGGVKPGESVPAQIGRELDRLDLPKRRIDLVGKGRWIKIHQPSAERGDATNAAKRGFEVKLTFESPATGPIALGHSCHFGLGLFAPV